MLCSSLFLNAQLLVPQCKNSNHESLCHSCLVLSILFCLWHPFFFLSRVSSIVHLILSSLGLWPVLLRLCVLWSYELQRFMGFGSILSGSCTNITPQTEQKRVFLLVIWTSCRTDMVAFFLLSEAPPIGDIWGEGLFKFGPLKQNEIEIIFFLLSAITSRAVDESFSPINYHCVYLQWMSLYCQYMSYIVITWSILSVFWYKQLHLAIKCLPFFIWLHPESKHRFIIT